MERFIKQAIMDHLLSKSLLSNKQYGFVPGRSWTLQLLVCIEKWSLELDSGKPVDIVYTDFSKAFDSLPPEADMETKKTWDKWQDSPLDN